jgi:hypothetical protein
MTGAAMPENPPTEGDADSTRDRFREALERKKGNQHGGEAHLKDKRNSGAATQNAKATRMFRRKSGSS